MHGESIYSESEVADHFHTGGVAPKVSVLMPTYKQADFIPRALESLRAQNAQRLGACGC